MPEFIEDVWFNISLKGLIELAVRKELRMSKKICIIVVSFTVVILIAMLTIKGVVNTAANDKVSESIQSTEDLWVGKETSLDDDTNFRKSNISDITYTIDGVSMSFSYNNSKSFKLDSENNVDGEQLYLVQDYYRNEKGFSIIEFETGQFRSFSKNNYSIIGGDKITLQEVEAIAYRVCQNSDIGITVESGDISVKDDGINRFFVWAVFDEGTVEITLDYTGGLQELSVKKNAYNLISEERRNNTIAKFNDKLEELNANPPDIGGRYEARSIAFIQRGDDIYAFFDVFYYPSPKMDVGSLYQYHCLA